MYKICCTSVYECHLQKSWIVLWFSVFVWGWTVTRNFSGLFLLKTLFPVTNCSLCLSPCGQEHCYATTPNFCRTVSWRLVSRKSRKACLRLAGYWRSVTTWPGIADQPMLVDKKKTCAEPLREPELTQHGTLPWNVFRPYSRHTNHQDSEEVILLHQNSKDVATEAHDDCGLSGSFLLTCGGIESVAWHQKKCRA